MQKKIFVQWKIVVKQILWASELGGTLVCLIMVQP